MNIILKVTPEILKTKAAEVESEVRILEKHFDGIQDIMARTVGYWVGTGGQTARQEFDDQKEDIKLVLKRFREHPIDLLTMAGIYEETERKLNAENQALVTDIIV